MSCLIRKFFPLWLVWCAVLFLAGHAAAQRSQIAASPAQAPTMRQMIQQSGVIFAGTVLKVERPSTRAGELATVRTAFHVDQAIRGVGAGKTLEIREWAGLWDSGERYSPGERVVLLLYPRSKLGLTSPVGGALGRFNVNSHGEVIVQDTQMSALASHLGPAGTTTSTSHRTSQITVTNLLRVIRHGVAE